MNISEMPDNIIAKYRDKALAGQRKHLYPTPRFAWLQGWAVAFVLLLVLCALTSCTSTKYITVPEMHTDTLYISKMQRDSIWLHDSIHVTERQQGDTFFVEVAKWKTKYIERLQTDTLIEHRTDIIPYPVEVIKEVPRDLTWWQKMRMRCGEASLTFLFIYIIYSIYKIKRRIFV